MRLSIVSLVVAFFVALPLTAWSQGPGMGDTTRSRDQDQVQDCTGFVDADGDGVCDLCGGDHDPDQTRDRDQDRTGDCTTFVDEDGDGICDLCQGDHAGDGEGNQAGRRFMRGEVNGDGVRGVGDAIRILRGLFLNEPLACEDAADANDDGSVDVSDSIRILLALFCAGGEIPAPCRNAGNDPTPDGLGCQ